MIFAGWIWTDIMLPRVVNERVNNVTVYHVCNLYVVGLGWKD